MNNELSQRDMNIQKLKNVIENRKKLLREIYKGIRNSTEENRYLKGVVRDYTNYYAYMKKQKEKQLEGLYKLEFYIDNVLQQNSKSASSKSANSKSANSKNANSKNENKGHILRQSQEDKKSVEREIKKVKREINDIQ